MKATLLVFNDIRKDPTWDLTEDQVNKLHQHLCQLPGTMDTWDRIDYQKYHGINIFLADTESMRIFSGFVEISSRKEVRRFVDYNRDLEMWIFQTSRDKISDGIYDQLLITEFE